MANGVTLERAIEFGAAWNSGDPDLVASFFADDGAHHTALGPDHLGRIHRGKEEIRSGAAAFFEHFPDGKFVNLKVMVVGNFGSFEWDFLATDLSGKTIRTIGYDLLAFRGNHVVLKNAFVTRDF